VIAPSLPALPGTPWPAAASLIPVGIVKNAVRFAYAANAHYPVISWAGARWIGSLHPPEMTACFVSGRHPGKILTANASCEAKGPASPTRWELQCSISVRHGHSPGDTASTPGSRRAAEQASPHSSTQSCIRVLRPFLTRTALNQFLSAYGPNLPRWKRAPRSWRRPAQTTATSSRDRVEDAAGTRAIARADGDQYHRCGLTVA